jgi:hypothetical protein
MSSSADGHIVESHPDYVFNIACNCKHMAKCFTIIEMYYIVFEGLTTYRFCVKLLGYNYKDARCHIFVINKPTTFHTQFVWV